MEKANGVTSGSSEESDCEPQTTRKARFEALKRQFETPTKSEEKTPSHCVPVKRQRLLHTPSSQSVQTARMKAMLPDPPKEDQDPMAQPLKVTEQDHQVSHSVDIVHSDF